MKKLSKEIGISVLLSITTNGSGGEVLGQTAKVLTSSAFDRAMEKEADLKAVEYLQNAQINPVPFSDLLGRFAEKESEIEEYISWTSSHPASQERSQYVLEMANAKSITYQTIISDSTWEKCKEIVVR
jgi:predicted Zn-dependent protease